MRIITLSVDGIHQAAQRGLFDWIADQDADVICLQDLRALEYELDHEVFHPPGYFAYFFDSGIKHYNGVAIYTRHQPKALIYGLGFASGVDMEGRYLQVDYEHYSIGSLLAPSALSETESLEVKIKFFEDFQALLHKVTRKRRRITGHINNPLRPHIKHGLQQFLITPFSRRVHNNNVWLQSLVAPPWHDFFGLSHVEFSVIHFI